MADDLSSSQKAVQGIHAAIESAKSGLLTGQHPNVVFCAVPDSESLNRLSDKLLFRNVEHRVFTEPDLNDKVTAIATRTVQGSERKLFSNLRLVR